MRIGVLSDTHIPHTRADLPPEISQAFKSVDLILHAGDLTELRVLGELNKLAKTTAVFGNMDSTEVRTALREKEIIRVNGFSIGLIHGWGAAFGVADCVKNEFKEDISAVIFGHSHAAMNEIRNGILFFNPGSPTDKIFAKSNSYGILTVTDAIKGEIITLNGR